MRLRKMNIIVLVILCFAAWGFSWVLTNRQRPVFSTVLMSPQITNFSFKAGDGKTNTLKDVAAGKKTTLVHVWASWCPPCVTEFPELLQFVKDNPDTVLIALSVDQDPQKMKVFIQKYQAKEHPRLFFVWDQDKKISKETLGVTQYPETLVLNSDLSLREHVRGVGVWRP